MNRHLLLQHILELILKIQLLLQHYFHRLPTLPQNFLDSSSTLKVTLEFRMRDCMSDVLKTWGMVLTFYISSMMVTSRTSGSNQEMSFISSNIRYSGSTVPPQNASRAIIHLPPHRRLQIRRFASRSNFMMEVQHGFMVHAYAV
jgi:hypothetical protein